MITVIQRVTEATVRIDGHIKGQIGTGFLVLLGIAHTDTADDGAWLLKDIAGIRILNDADGKTNLYLAAVQGNVLLMIATPTIVPIRFPG